MLHEDRDRAMSFGADPGLYHRTRPSYPERLVLDLLADGGREVLDVGCGTGIVSLLFRAQGCRVLGLEPDPRMAAFAGSHGLEVEVATLEAWESRDRTFDLLVAGQAWHWVDPHAGAAKAATVLRPGGRVGLFWNYARHPEYAQARFDSIYKELAPGLDEHSIVLGRGTDERFELAADALGASGSFGPVEQREYLWSKSYTKAQWHDHLLTHSDHQALPPERRDPLLDAIDQALEDFGGAFVTEYRTILVTATTPADRR